jgi:hypothetical protein
MDIDIEANIAAANEATRQRALSTPDDIKAAMKAIGHALPDAEAREHYVKLREYIGFLQMTIAVAWMPAAQKTEGA